MNREVAVSDALNNALEELAQVQPLILLNRFDEAVERAKSCLRSMPLDRRRRDRRVVREVAGEQVDATVRLIETVPEGERHAVERAFLVELCLLTDLFAADVRRRWSSPRDGRP